MSQTVLEADRPENGYIGKSIAELPAPAAVVDLAKVRAGCDLMLSAVNELGLKFRAHVKTHKTVQFSQLQLGESSKDVRIVVSTIVEAEQLVPMLLKYKGRGAKISVLYGVPVGPSRVSRLAAVGMALGAGTVSFMVDHVAQIPSLKTYKSLTGHAAGVFVKTDSGYHRAGLHPLSQEMVHLVKELSVLDDLEEISLLGFYSHNSLSYGGSSPDDAMNMLKKELDVCRQASRHFESMRLGRSPMIVSVGASPTALSIQNILSTSTSTSSSAQSLKSALGLTTLSFELEIHAGVYPFFDLQQVGTNSRKFKQDPHETIAISVLAEVCSLYPTRTEKPEALISAGCLALAREPCKSYQGWGVVSSWRMPAGYDHIGNDRIVVGRISQEHGVLTRESECGVPLPLTYGQLVRILPNHACITMAMFDHYFIVDSNGANPDKIIDVYTRWRGW